MKIGFVVNDIKTEIPGYTTTHLALAATRLGHEAWYINVSDFTYDTDERIHAKASRVAQNDHRTCGIYLQRLWRRDAIRAYIDVCELDVLMLRNDPAEDVVARPWARLAGINFGRFAACHGVVVVNDPDGLAQAVNKLYLQEFPEHVRPKVLISRNRDQIKAFTRAMGGTAVLKPLYGSGGRNVFLVRPQDMPNLNQMIEAVARDGYMIAQEYLPEAVHGDTRVFMLNGEPLRHNDRYAVIQRVRGNGDMRSNMTAGATSAPSVMTDEILALTEAIRPRLIEDGMYFVGLDIVGDKLMEINVFSPGGVESAEHYTGVNFSQLIIQDLERKVASRRATARRYTNKELAVL